MTAYLDAAATTRMDPRVAEVVLHWMTEDWGNAGSRTHGWGTRAKRAVQQAREQLARQIGVSSAELIFTSGATESNNIALLGLAPHGERQGRRHIITSAIEHKAVIEPLEHLVSRGFEVDFISPGSSGRVSVEAIQEHLRDDTLLVSLMHVNNETGVIQPVAELADHLRGTATYLHVDAAQGFGKLTEDLRGPIDLISISGHKIGAPKGVGALVIRRRGRDTVPLTPLMYGGGQERKLRPGTLPVPLVAGLAKAAEIFENEHADWWAATAGFRARLVHALRKTQVRFNGDQEHVVPHILNVSFDGVDAEALIVQIKELVAVSTGSACTSASYTPSHVLRGMGLPDNIAANGLRLSWFPDQANELDVDELAAEIAEFQAGTAFLG
ncbi:cysteine desulfurase DndA [Actinomadura sp. HBU206391]|uniref:cysteine desulfurase DndA n=1 Tax=Actinomadura sp. HBU206391 TaxID=2731692 RepID=UPI0016507ACA|nr:cysteine desulfurase DndA [Actinomadura sp. HBU206391]MBC6456612.1 cysteine desulfurase DndA [Actinomadura sp. HBU206391]